MQFYLLWYFLMAHCLINLPPEKPFSVQRIDVELLIILPVMSFSVSDRLLVTCSWIIVKHDVFSVKCKRLLHVISILRNKARNDERPFPITEQVSNKLWYSHLPPKNSIFTSNSVWIYLHQTIWLFDNNINNNTIQKVTTWYNQSSSST